MDKRLLYVLPLCLAIVLGWGILAEKLGWVQKPAPRPPAPPAAPAEPAAREADSARGAASAPAAVDPGPPAVGPVVADDAERRETFVVGRPGEPGYYRATFSNRGAVLVELRTGNDFDRAGRSAEERADPAHWRVLVGEEQSKDQPGSFALRATLSAQPLVREPLESALWRGRLLGAEGQPEGVEYELAPGTGVTFVKRFRFVPGSDQVLLELEIKNDAFSDVSGYRGFLLTPAAGVPNDSGDSFYLEPQGVAVARPAGESKPSIKVQMPERTGSVLVGTIASPKPLLYAGVHNKYFAVLVRAADAETAPTLQGASWRALRDEAWLARHPGKDHDAWRQLVVDVDLQLALPPVGASRTWNYAAYAGPKQRDQMVAVLPAHSALLEEDLGFVSSVAGVLLWILGFFHSLTSSWGLAIVLLTLVVRVVLFPLNRRSQTAMARYQSKMKRIQPRIEELKKRYEKDPKKLREEQARIMQEEGAFPPLGGCLPPLLQLPIFIGLFRAIGVSFDLHQEPFLGIIRDLSLPDQLLPLGLTLPLVGHVAAINVLPPIMVVMWILQQRAMPRPTEEQALLMYKMMMWMPIVMGIFLYNYAAGLSIYMITTSTLGIIEQVYIKKRWPIDDKELPKKSGGFMSKLMEAAAERQKQAEAQRRKQKVR
ncbi:MAG: membrane protein insertase YidC [Planctomycetes bacterium]|nr:membrane protein insertase YidC [Planctomycetota bacterium]